MPYVTDPYYDSVNTLSWMVSFCAPFFYANNSFAGVIGTDLNLQAIQSYVASYQVGQTGFAVPDEPYWESHCST